MARPVPKAHSSSTVFRFQGKKMVGVFARPAEAGRRRVPGVLMLHGYPGSEKNVDVARGLMRRGIATFTLHFMGAWGSEGIYRFSTLVDQAMAGLRFLSSRPMVDSKRLGLFGYSMGGWTAVNLAARARNLKATVAVAPVAGPSIIGPDLDPFLERLSAPLRAPATRALTRDFRRAVARQDAAKSVTRVSAPLLLIHGTDDGIVPVTESKRIAAAAPKRAKLVLARGADHAMLDRRPWLVRRSVEFLEGRL